MKSPGELVNVSMLCCGTALGDEGDADDPHPNVVSERSAIAWAAAHVTMRALDVTVTCSSPGVGHNGDFAANRCRRCIALLFKGHLQAIRRSALAQNELRDDKSSTQR